jgi:hypothetical protein
MADEKDNLIAAAKTPKMFLIGRRALSQSPERYKEALRLFLPLQGAFVCGELDALLAREVTENVMGLHQPFALVADLPFDLAAVLEGGELVEVKLPEVASQDDQLLKQKLPTELTQ